MTLVVQHTALSSRDNRRSGSVQAGNRPLMLFRDSPQGSSSLGSEPARPQSGECRLNPRPPLHPLSEGQRCDGWPQDRFQEVSVDENTASLNHLVSLGGIPPASATALLVVPHPAQVISHFGHQRNLRYWRLIMSGPWKHVTDLHDFTLFRLVEFLAKWLSSYVLQVLL
jgi:hypothetical protein